MYQERTYRGWVEPAGLVASRVCQAASDLLIHAPEPVAERAGALLAEVERALGYLRQRGVRLIFPAKNLIYDEQRCTHCGACVAQCLVQALHVEPDSDRVRFDHDKCLACELCIPVRVIDAFGPDAAADASGPRPACSPSPTAG